jgi:hypothetical protein
LKYRNEAGPTCQSQKPIKPLAPGYRSPAHARATAASHAPEARAPPATRSTPCSTLRCPRALVVIIHCHPWAASKPTPVSPHRSPLASPGSPLRRLAPRSDELSKKAPQAPRAPPPRVTELCSSQAASLKTTAKPLHQTVPPPWTPPHHRPPPATDRPRRQSSSITPSRSSSPTREPPALLTRQRHHRRFPLA